MVVDRVTSVCLTFVVKFCVIRILKCIREQGDIVDGSRFIHMPQTVECIRHFSLFVILKVILLAS